MLAIVLIAGCVSSPAVSPSQHAEESAAGFYQENSSIAKFGFDYCACGLHQTYAMAEQECYFHRQACEESDRDPNADPCIAYRQITGLYQEGSCNPNWDNPDAVNSYCALILPGANLCGFGQDILDKCGAERPDDCPDATRLSLEECTGFSSVQGAVGKVNPGKWHSTAEACEAAAQQYAWGEWAFEEGYCFRCELYRPIP
jgi:hypothetical protein